MNTKRTVIAAARLAADPHRVTWSIGDLLTDVQLPGLAGDWLIRLVPAA
jgi:hypothetical protein